MAKWTLLSLRSTSSECSSLKRLSDNFAQKRKELEAEYKDDLTPEELEDFLEDKTSYGSTFFVPREARWECEDNGDGWTGLLHVKVDVAAKLKRALVAIEKENSQLDGVLKNIDFAKKVKNKQIITNERLGSACLAFQQA